MAPIIRWLNGSQLCAQADPEMWFADDVETQNKAIAICQHCPLQSDCLQYATEHMVQGIWGGTRETTRHQLRKKLGIVGIQVKLTGFK